MKNTIGAILLSIASISAFGQTIDHAGIAQKQRQQANAGAIAAQAAYDKGGLVGVAELSSTCFSDAQRGARPSDYCLGIEAVGVSMRDKSSDSDASAKSWFDHPQMTNRVLTHCIQYLGLRGDMACGQRLAVARGAIPERALTPVAAPSSIAKAASNSQGEIMINGRGQVLASGKPNMKELRCVHNLVDKEKEFSEGWEEKILSFCKK
jgi:hypothetical protein